jgi:hypothetical protein
MGSGRKGTSLGTRVNVVGVFVDSRVKQEVIVGEIPIVDQDFPTLAFVEAVYFFTLFTRKKNGKIQGWFLYRKEEFLYLVLIHGRQFIGARRFFPSPGSPPLRRPFLFAGPEARGRAA